MRAALLAATALWPITAFGQQTDQGTAQMIMSSQASQVPGGECAATSPCQSQGLVPITFQQGDVVLQGSITDAQGNTWSLQPDSCNGNSPGNWWSGVYENGQEVACGYTVALRNVGGVVWEEEAKGSGWQPVTNMTLGEGMVGPYVADPGQGSAGAPIATSHAADTTTQVSPASVTSGPVSDPNAPCHETGAVTPGNGTFTVGSNTYSIDATDGDVASINGAPINSGAYETSQLVQGGDGNIYGQSNAANNDGQWFTLQGSGRDTWWQPSAAPPASTSGASSAMATSAGPVVCPTTPSIQAQISADNQEIQQLLAQIHAYQTAPTTTTAAAASAVTPAPTDSTSSGGSDGGDGGGGGDAQ